MSAKRKVYSMLLIVSICIPTYFLCSLMQTGRSQEGPPKIIEGSVYIMIGIENLTTNEVYYENKISIYFTVNGLLKTIKVYLVKQNSPNLVPYEIPNPNSIDPQGKYQADVDLTNVKRGYGIGTFDLIINMTDTASRVGSHNQTGFLKITDVKPQTGGEFSLDVDWRIILIVGVVIVVLSVIPMILKKQKMKKTLTEIDQSLEKVDEKTAKKAKRRERVVGASAIGKLSGLEAEVKHSKEEDKKPEQKPQEKKSLVKERLKEPSVKMVDLDEKRKLESKTPESEEDVAALLSTKAPSTMQIKMQEKGLDLDRKAAFLESKINGLNQNLVLSKMILDQTNQALKKERECPICGYRFPIEESECPNCVVNNVDPNLLETKLQNVKQIGNKSLCLVCRKIVEPEWSECPYCLANSKN